MSNPAIYALTNHYPRIHTTSLLKEYSNKIKIMGGACMDIGCGPGDVTTEILLPALHQSARLIGIDISEHMLKYANKMYPNKKRIEFDKMDIQMDIVPEKYVFNIDHIFSFYTLHWCNDIRKAFQNIYQMLRSGGTIFFSMVCEHNLFHITKHFSQDNRYAPYIKNMDIIALKLQYHSEPHKEIRKLLSDVGFQIHDCRTRQMTINYENLDKLISMLMSISMFVDDMPPELKQEYKKDFTKEYTKRIKQRINNRKETCVIDQYKLLTAYGRKET